MRGLPPLWQHLSWGAQQKMRMIPSEVAVAETLALAMHGRVQLLRGIHQAAIQKKVRFLLTKSGLLTVYRRSFSRQTYMSPSSVLR